MQEEQHHDRFDVDADYEGGQFIGGEFFYASKRQKRQQTEDDRIYGIFASGSDSDDDRRQRGRKAPADYSAPVSFVSKGVVNKAPQEAEQVKEEEPWEDGDRAGRGLGAGPSTRRGGDGGGSPQQGARVGLGGGGGAGGLGFSKGEGRRGGARQEDEDEEAVLPTAFGARIKARAAQRRQAEAQVHKQEKQRKEHTTADPEFANFEKHTKGIGLKLLQKMGYKPGEGLGRDKSGIIKPVEAKQRAKGMGMGFGQRHAREDVEESKPMVQGPGTAEAGAQGKMWKKRHAEVRVKREYKTASEVLAGASARPLAAQPILDMRGPQARLITNMDHINVQEDTAGGSKVPMPELQHNLQLLVDLAEADIQKLDAKLRHEQDSATLLGREKSRLEDEALQLELQLRRMSLVLDQVARCEAGAGTAAGGSKSGTAAANQPPQLTLPEIEQVYNTLYKEYREEYILYNIGTAALSHALNRLIALFQGWQPLLDPTRGAAEFRRWRALLDPQGTSSSASGGVGFHGGFSETTGQDAYTQLVCEAVLPPLRSACTQWQPRDPEPLLAWLEAWEQLLPHTALVHVLDMLVMPALRRAVTDWEPRSETVPIHAWLHPWLPFLGPALEELYPVIRGKLAAALHLWEAHDGSALVLLRPWHKVFGAVEWDTLMAQCIVPKLAKALAGLQINPVAQDMAPFNCVMAWAEVMPAHHMASLLEQGFFIQWQQVLAFWLSHQPNYDEVTRWYLGWKAAFPPALLDQERIRRQFNLALDMMNNAVDGNMAGGAAGAAAAGAANAAYMSRWATDSQPDMQQQQQHQAQQVPHVAHVTSAADMTLKELVQRFAAEHGIQFFPKPGRFQDGLQVYAFGTVSVILDNTHSSLRALVNNRWAPVTLEALVMTNAAKAK